MTAKLLIQAITKVVLGIVLVGLLIFLPAGTFLFFNGWLLMGVLFIPMLFAGILMMCKNPELLTSGLNAKEKQADQSLVVRENTYLSRTIEVQDNQKVIDTGLYGIVRHPMYSATLLLFLSMPIVLGSIYSFIIFLAYLFIIAKRIKGEEEFLEENLVGYHEYKQRVKYRLIPFIW